MAVFKDLFASDVGLLSAGTILFILGMAVYFVRYFLKHMHEDEARRDLGAQR
jgi:uncharacterized membrane-anchored protein